MRILFIAPHIFYRARGSSLGVYYRAKALGNIGHKVDVLCYHLGDALPPGSKNVRIIRAPRVPCSKKVDAGPSWSKIILDASLFSKAILQVMLKRYDVVHTTEEASLIGAVLRTLAGMGHVYNVHSIMSTQLEDFNFSRSRLLARVLDILQKFAIRHSDVLVPVSGNLADALKKIDPEAMILTIEDTAVLKDEPAPSPAEVERLRKSLKLEGKKAVVYTGSFFKIQNLELVLEAAPAVIKKIPKTMFVFVGGSKQEIDELKAKASSLGVEKNVLLLEKRPLKDMPAFYRVADLLISPRSIGINATLKIYSYLNAGKPILATNTPVHTQQIQEPDVVLAEPEKRAWSNAMIRILSDKKLQKQLSRNGQYLIKTKYCYERFEQRMDEAVRTAKDKR